MSEESSEALRTVRMIEASRFPRRISSEWKPLIDEAYAQLGAVAAGQTYFTEHDPGDEDRSPE